MRTLRVTTVFVFIGLLDEAFGRTAEEWKTRVGIYQLLTDRFSVGESDPSEECTDLRHYCGGTYAGLISKLDYLQGLGVDAIWISPIPYNSYDDGYHGYAAEDIYRLNPSFGPEEDLRQLLDECHARDIWVMLDVVPNHMGIQDSCTADNGCPDPYDFSQFTPFDQPEHYHEFCEIEDYDDQYQVENCRLFLLADLDQENSFVNQTLCDWIANQTTFGFDGYRVDTVRHIAKEFFPPYQQAANAYLVGEVNTGDTDYVADYQNYIDGVLNVPLYWVIRHVFNDGYSMTYMRDNVEYQRSQFVNVHYNAPFVDNHDQPRFLSMTPNLNMLKSALSVAFFLEGIPILYYGTEQAFDGTNDPENRESLWPHFDENSEMYVFMRETLAARRGLIPAIIEAPSVEKYTDDRTYVFSRGPNLDVLVAASNGFGMSSRDGYSVTVDLGPDAPVGAVYYNAHDQEEILNIVGQTVTIDFDYDLPPKVYVRIV